ncbi:hypothetical protein Lser_V15G41246 [Lactuca serriola]
MTWMNINELLDNVDDVAEPTTETREEEDVLIVSPPPTNTTAEIVSPVVITSGIPSLDVISPTSEPVECDPTTIQVTPPTSKRRRLDPRLVTPSVSAPPKTTPVIVSNEPFTEGTSTIYETGDSSFPTNFSPPRPEHDATSARLASLLAREQLSTPPAHSKGICIEGGNSGEEIPSLSELQKQVVALSQKNVELDQRNTKLDIKVAGLQAENTQLSIQMAELNEENAAKTKQITDLQIHFGLLTASYYDLKKKLEDKFSDEFRSSVDEPLIYLPNQDVPIAPTSTSANIRTTTIVNRFENEPEQAPPGKASKHKKSDKEPEKSQLLFKRSVDHKAPWDQQLVTVTDLVVQRFRDTYGDKSGIIGWGFHDTMNMFMVRRKSGSKELYKDAHDFNYFTKIDLIELSKAPFSNPSNNPRASLSHPETEDGNIPGRRTS